MLSDPFVSGAPYLWIAQNLVLALLRDGYETLFFYIKNRGRRVQVAPRGRANVLSRRCCAIGSASLIHTVDAEGFLGIKNSSEETWGRRCDINTADAALQFMSCTRVTGYLCSGIFISISSAVFWYQDMMDQAAVHKVILLCLLAG